MYKMCIFANIVLTMTCSIATVYASVKTKLENLMKATIFLGVLFLIITSANAFANDSATQIEEAKKIVKKILKDADSARFQNLSIETNSKGEESICGEANARNSFGGYTGYSKFSVSQNMANIIDPDRPSIILQYSIYVNGMLLYPDYNAEREQVYDINKEGIGEKIYIRSVNLGVEGNLRQYVSIVSEELRNKISAILF